MKRAESTYAVYPIGRKHGYSRPRLEFVGKVEKGTKLSLPWTAPAYSSDDPQLARMVGIQMGNDLCDLAMNGDKESSDPLLHTLDGVKKRRIESHAKLRVAIPKLTATKAGSYLFTTRVQLVKT